MASNNSLGWLASHPRPPASDVARGLNQLSSLAEGQR